MILELHKDDNQIPIWTIDVDRKLWNEWYDEVMRRWEKAEAENAKTMKWVWAVSECVDLQKMSVWHLQDLLKFISTKK